ncbi:MAG: DUF1987 family protein [Bacteroidota bacterium]|nr:MAG: DUF1987 family protein [Bacteroidota bacterium]
MFSKPKIKAATMWLPAVEVKKKLKRVVVTGRSHMSDPGEYYNEFANTLSDLFTEFNYNLFLDFHFDYVNTGSSKWLLFVLQYLEAMLKEKGGQIEITWKYDSDDESMLTTGELFRSITTIPLVLKEVD